MLTGRKKATTSLKALYEKKLPKIGDLSVVTDYWGNPKAIIQTTNVLIMPFKDMTFDICKLEGEDNSLESWRTGHRSFFKAETLNTDIVFNEDSEIIFEEFKVIYK